MGEFKTSATDQKRAFLYALHKMGIVFPVVNQPLHTIFFIIPAHGNSKSVLIFAAHSPRFINATINIRKSKGSGDIAALIKSLTATI